MYMCMYDLPFAVVTTFVSGTPVAMFEHQMGSSGAEIIVKEVIADGIMTNKFSLGVCQITSHKTIHKHTIYIYIYIYIYIVCLCMVLCEVIWHTPRENLLVIIPSAMTSLTIISAPELPIWCSNIATGVPETKVVTTAKGKSYIHIYTKA